MGKHAIWIGLICGLMLLGCSKLYKGESLVNQERYDEAVPLLETYLAENPDSIEARNQLGFAYLKTGRIEDAVREFESVLKAQPGEPYAVMYLGLAYLNQKKFAETIAVWQQYRNENKAWVEEKIRRLQSILHMVESRKAAQAALADEARLQTVKPEGNTIAVCYFNDLSPDHSLKAFQKGLTAMIITDLVRVKTLKVVERQRLQALLSEMKMGQTGIVDPATAPRVGKLLGSEHLVVGTLAKGSIAVTTSLTTASEGTVQGDFHVSVDEDHFYDLSKNIVLGLAKLMHLDLTEAETAAIGRPATTNFQAFVYYGQALDALDAGDWKTAENLFIKALVEDPKFKLAKESFEMCPDPLLELTVLQFLEMDGSRLRREVESYLTERRDYVEQAQKLEFLYRRTADTEVAPSVRTKPREAEAAGEAPAATRDIEALIDREVDRPERIFQEQQEIVSEDKLDEELVIEKEFSFPSTP